MKAEEFNEAYQYIREATDLFLLYYKLLSFKTKKEFIEYILVICPNDSGTCLWVINVHKKKWKNW